MINRSVCNKQFPITFVHEVTSFMHTSEDCLLYPLSTSSLQCLPYNLLSPPQLYTIIQKKKKQWFRITRAWEKGGRVRPQTNPMEWSRGTLPRHFFIKRLHSIPQNRPTKVIYVAAFYAYYNSPGRRGDSFWIALWVFYCTMKIRRTIAR